MIKVVDQSLYLQMDLESLLEQLLTMLLKVMYEFTPLEDTSTLGM